MSMTKDEALLKIKELKEFVKKLDKPKLVRVYVKEGLVYTPSLVCGGVDFPSSTHKSYEGRLFDVFYRGPQGGINIRGLFFHSEWVVFVEGSYEDLKL